MLCCRCYICCVVVDAVVVVVVVIDVGLFLFCFKQSKELATEEIMGSRCGTAVEYTSPNQEVTGLKRTGIWTFPSLLNNKSLNRSLVDEQHYVFD